MLVNWDVTVLLLQNHFGLGYAASDFVIHTSITNGTDFGGSVFQKVLKAVP
jgi:hypothetical protein